MTGVRKPVENHSRSLRAMISASSFATVSLSPWKARYTPPTFPHSHSPKPFLYLFHTHLRAFGAQERSPRVAMTQPLKLQAHSSIRKCLCPSFLWRVPERQADHLVA